VQSYVNGAEVMKVVVANRRLVNIVVREARGGAA
jgi:hypothetical protein